MRRKKLYSMMENYAQYDEKENQIMVSSRDIQSNSNSINEFPNFPNTFLSKMQFRNSAPDEDLESDLMDSDDTNQGLGLQEQNNRLLQMTLPVFFKNILIGRNGATRQTRLQQPAQPFSQDFSFDSYQDSDNFQLTDSVIFHEELPRTQLLPRYFDDIVMVICLA